MEVNVLVIVDSGSSSSSSLLNRNWDFSYNRNFVQNWGWYRNRSSDRYSSYNWILNMMNISLMDIFLDNRLGDDLLGRSLNSLNSILSVELSLFDNWVHLNGLVLSSVKSYIDVFSLNNRLDVSLVVDFSSWSFDSLSSGSVFNSSFSCDWISVDGLSRRRNKVNSFSVIDNLSLKDWLGQNFSCRSLEISIDSFVLKFSGSSDWLIVNSSSLSSLNI